ncbi:glucosyl transferase, partial [Candidatus Parcubacteria bacterium]
ERLSFPAVAETTVVDTGLLPAHSYSYAARLEKDGQTAARSNSVQLTTMDTTSHDFSWEIYEFGGQHGSSVLYDVAIVDENNIWAVGEIHTAETDTFDSLGNWVNPYNAVHWDGNEWELKRILVQYRGQPNWAPLEGVFALPDGQIIFSSGLPYLPENGHWKLFHLWDMGVLGQNDGSVNRIWGTSINNLYFAGKKGTIVHYDGSGWRRIESGTELDIYDIWGSFNQNSGILEILCTGSKHLQDPEFRRVIFKLENNTLTELSSSPIHWTLYSVWFIPEHIYYVVGSGVYRKYSLKDKQWQQVQNATQYYSYRIRGIAINDIMVVGGFGEIVHFNGLNWRSYIHQTRLSGNYY